MKRAPRKLSESSGVGRSELCPQDGFRSRGFELCQRTKDLGVTVSFSVGPIRIGAPQSV